MSSAARIKSWSDRGQALRDLHIRKKGDKLSICITPAYYPDFDQLDAVVVSVPDLLSKIAEAMKAEP